MENRTHRSKRGQALAERRDRRLTLILLVALTLAMAVLVAPSVRPGIMASGADAGSYLLTTRYIVDSLRETGVAAAINPVWYNGFAVFHNTPLLVYIPLTLIYWLLGDIVTTSHWAHVLFGALPALAGFLALRRRFNPWASALGALLFASSNVILGQVTLGGSYPRSLAMALGVLCFASVDRAAEEGITARTILPVALLLGTSIVAHPLTGVAFLGCWAVYFLIRSIAGGTLTVPRLVKALALPVAAFAAAAWYLVPFFAERQGWTTLPYEIYEMNSMEMAQSYGWLGLPLIAVGALGVLLRWKEPHTKAFFWSGLLAVLLAGGSYTHLDLLVPALRAAYPFVFLFYLAFALSALAVTGLEAAASRGRAWRAAGALVLVAALVAGIVGARAFSADAADVAAGFSDADDAATAAFVRDAPGNGRVMLMRYPFSYLLWRILGETDKPNVEGWYYSLTPTGRHIAWAYDASDHGFPEYTAELFERWNIRQLVTNGNWGSVEDDALLALLEQRGFSSALQQGANAVYASEESAAFVQPLKATTLAVGRHAATAAMMLPGAVVGGSEYIDDYPPELLASFDTLILAGFGTRDRDAAERLVAGYAAGGGTVVIDLNGMLVNAIEDAPSFLGVKGYARIAEDAVGIRVNEQGASGAVIPTALDLPRAKRVETDETIEDWRYVAYLGLDRSIADEIDGDGMSLLGTEELDGGGQAVFVGGNLFYHAFLTGDAAEVALVRSLADPVTWGREPRTAALGEAAALAIDEAQTDTTERVAFAYSAQTDTLVLVSWATSPHWKAYLDGEPLRIHNIEDLMVLSVPAGDHSVELRYQDLPLHYLAIGISLFTLLLLALAAWRERTSQRKHTGSEAAPV